MTTLLEVAWGGLSGLLETLIPTLLESRARKGKEDPERIGERMGRPSAPRPDGPLVWLHGVSVGETTSLLPLVEALRERRPDLNLLVTSGTVTSAALLAGRLPPGVVHQYVPVDTPQSVRRFLDHWRPGLAIFVESELWPNLIHGAEKRGVKLALVSARITEATASRWARVPATARSLLGAFRLVLPQDLASAERLRAMGAQPKALLNLKLVGEPLPFDAAELDRLRSTIGRRRVVLAASTHPGEEALIAPQVEDALLVVAPRHPERGKSLAAEFDAPRRSAGDLPTAAPIYVADTLGELGLFFRLADVVIMGGSFLRGIGGHNPLEPARLGRPILTGPHVFNAADLYADMAAKGAARVLPDADALRPALRGPLEPMGAAALAYAGAQSGALDDALALLDPLLPQ